MKLCVWVMRKLFKVALWCIGGIISYIIGLYVRAYIAEVILK